MKWNKKRFLSGAAGLILALLLASCSATRSPKPGFSDGESSPFPAGVDSSLAAKVDSISRSIFVNWERQQQARVKLDIGEQQFEKSNQMWLALMSLGDSSAIHNEDSLEAIRQFNSGAQQLIALRELQQKGNLDENAFRKQSLILMDSARSAFERSVRLNPFDRNSRLWLSRVYQMLAERYMQTTRLEDAALTLEKLIRMDRSQHGLYGRLGQIYMTLEKWDSANFRFRSAEEVLRNTAVFRVPQEQNISDSTIAAALDSSTLFLYVYYQGESNIRRYESAAALNDLQRALPLARWMG
jgi:tetratricopeptide (TPR) repeat protein